MLKILVTTVTCTIFLCGCLGSMQSPIATQSEASRASLGILCKRYVKFPPANNFNIYAKKELERRGFDLDKCFSMVK